MQVIDYQIKSELRSFVNCIMFDECNDHRGETKIPIYADGYPGIMFQEAENGFYLNPKGKKLSQFFLLNA